MTVINSVAAADLISAVAAARSWRAVLRELGLPETSSRLGRLARARCDELGIDYSHFRRHKSWTDEDLLREVQLASSWKSVLRALRYPADSGSARSTIRGHCARLGIDTAHLDTPLPEQGDVVDLIARVASPDLGRAGPLLVAGLLTMKGANVSWPLEAAPYDLLVDAGAARTLRVQVKTTTYRKAGSWVCSIRRAAYDPSRRWSERRVYDVDEVDHFAVVDGDLAVYLLPVSVVGGRGMVSLRKYDAFRIGDVRFGRADRI